MSPTVPLLLALLAGGPARPEIVPRESWGAQPRVLPMTRHMPTHITIHHTGTAQNPARSLEDKLRGLQTFSQREDKLASGRTKPAWPDVPYHFYISTDGRIGEGRPLIYVGDTNTEYDPAGHLLVVVEGSFDTETVTPAQFGSLDRVVLWLAWEWGVPAERIKGHSDYAKTACPGKMLTDYLPTLRSRLASARSSAGG